MLITDIKDSIGLPGKLIVKYNESFRWAYFIGAVLIVAMVDTVWDIAVVGCSFSYTLTRRREKCCFGGNKRNRRRCFSGCFVGHDTAGGHRERAHAKETYNKRQYSRRRSSVDLM